jgi:hypothetical protein
MCTRRSLSSVEDRPTRRVPDELARSWSKATSDPDPLTALGATTALNRGINGWQATLVREAIRGGATWEEVGEALGISRQAAWARFRDPGDPEGGRMQEEAAKIRERIQEQVRSLRESVRAMEDEHRTARIDAMERIREADRRFREERQELKDRMKATIRSLQDELRSRRRPG